MSQNSFPMMRWWSHALVVLALTLGSLSLWWLAKPAPVAGQVKAPDEATDDVMLFHDLHVRELDLVCTECHESAEAPKPGHEFSFSVRPGHVACDSCHEEEFEDEKVTAAYAQAPLCTMCHTGKGDAVGPFPSGRLTLARFSHAAHVDAHPPVSKLGIRQDCVFCHKIETTAASPGRAGHPECAACHSGSQAADPVLTKEVEDVEGCLTCHSLERVDRNMMKPEDGNGDAAARVELRIGSGLNPHGGSHLSAAHHPYRDIRPFNHGRHLRRRDGAPIDCAVCHEPVLDKRDVETPSRLPTMRECATCHDNAAFVRPQNLTKHCQTCHTIMNADNRPRPSDPVSPAIVHTEAFRVHHEVQARDPDNQCGACHTGVYSIGENNCAGCHHAMRPRSHFGPLFKEQRHGRLAGFDRRACASCHTGDFCIRCHSVPPRSHIPLSTFVGPLGAAHRDLAVLNLRSCFVCHTFEGDCARCHRRELR